MKTQITITVTSDDEPFKDLPDNKDPVAYDLAKILGCDLANGTGKPLRVVHTTAENPEKIEVVIKTMQDYLTDIIAFCKINAMKKSPFSGWKAS